jgi:predicted SprT family Zn-dependent metalloprotease
MVPAKRKAAVPAWLRRRREATAKRDKRRQAVLEQLETATIIDLTGDDQDARQLETATVVHSTEGNHDTDRRATCEQLETAAVIDPTEGAAAQKTSEREAKEAFESTKHELARDFLCELDDTITDGKLAELSASTGGIKLVWTNKLHTTAGQAHWKRKKIRHSMPLASSTLSATRTSYQHYASIELAEKIVNSPDRLFNVLAHEFCHLATSMLNGRRTKPHGKEFKAWGARVAQAFDAHGVHVTTTHSYEIDYKYVWRCVACATEFGRHSRIDPVRYRCGGYMQALVQVKPVPRKADQAATVDPETVDVMDLDDPNEWDVEEILDSHLADGQLQYLVKWLDFGPEDNSWQPATNLRCPEKLAEFYRQNPDHRPAPRRLTKYRPYCFA